MPQIVTMRLVLLARHDRPGEYEVLEADSRAVLFGPFFATPDPAVAVDGLCQRFQLDASYITVEWR